ncbi:hypothetical protein [Mycobacteroides abscessus]|uniref:hypothetical protein n=1 Tax=Mycobacteroides abscessus TaxID=36809 RepID=UPI00187835B2|nr:hypothetical protein [Mycobacteroides abscessus]
MVTETPPDPNSTTDRARGYRGVSVNGRPIPEAYARALDAPCPTCGAEAGEYCVVVDANRAPRVRRVPCVRRCPPGPPEPEPLAYAARSFSEPIHDPTDIEETH